MVLTIDEFIARETEHKLISRQHYNVEDTSVLIKVLRIEGVENSEFLKFEFETPVYYKVEKIYFTLTQQLMVLAPPYLYIDASQAINGAGSGFKISSAYEVCCDICGNQINYINTNLKQFYCDTCFMENESIDDTNIIVVLAGTLA
ncbi:MAG: hypothetical protein E6R13_01940 [Spirochaetes bacterium]|nr:MAG: hypothetical protein E6R13_01940 [Spirochaetota bacterium]